MSAKIIAETFGWDISEARECRYQPGRTKQPLYAVGNTYYCVSKSLPKDDVGAPWEKNRDQFFAERAGTVMWKATIGENAK